MEVLGRQKVQRQPARELCGLSSGAWFAKREGLVLAQVQEEAVDPEAVLQRVVLSQGASATLVSCTK